MSEHDGKHLITRRRTLALLGSTGSGFLLAGTSGGIGSALARNSEGDDYVAYGAEACTLTAEQEEGPFYVALEQVRENITGGQTGLSLELEITIINSLTCKRSSADTSPTPGSYSLRTLSTPRSPSSRPTTRRRPRS